MLNPQITDTIMEKKNFEAPYLKVVDVKNDIITGSNDGINTVLGARPEFETDYESDNQF